LADIELIKSKLDIVDIVGSYIELKRAGGLYKANCPFHSEKTPSFTVNPSMQIFKCFGCGKAGDAIKFIQEYERIDFKEALKIAAEKAGVQIDTYSNTQNTITKEQKERFYKANTLAASYYSYILKQHIAGKGAREYALKRQISIKEIEKFKFGFAPANNSNLKNFMLKKGYAEKELVELGLCIDRDGTILDKFRNRLVQPILDINGNILGFSGRYLGQSENAPKYLNSSESIVYKKNELLYDIFNAKTEITKTLQYL
jgi:DNA primase